MIAIISVHIIRIDDGDW